MSETKSKFANSDSFSSSKRKNNGLLTLIVGIIILIILVIALFLVFLKPAMNQTSSSSSSSWSAVFLTNGRTYFGKIEKDIAGFITLNDVYYLQVKQAPPVAEGEEPQSQLSLMSVGEEIHGPENFMRINKDHVLFIEELKADSSIVTSIEQLLGQ